jgi:hypothetical protein
MAIPVVILHGYGGSPKGWEKMADRLVEKHGGPVTRVFLGDFKTKEDDLVYGDLSEGLDQELKKQAKRGRLGRLGPRSFSIIAHSTGAPVVRHWLQCYYGDTPDKIPLKHLVLLAPANFGSRLAHHGNAEYGRFINFLMEPGWENWETGRNILDGLELASPFTWDLAMGDILKPGGHGPNPHVLNADGFYTSVIIGNQPYTGRIQRRFPARAEAGSDGTVRIAAAALSSRRVNIDFAKKPLQFSATDGYSEVPLAVVPGVNHSDVKTDRRVLDLVLKALRVDGDASFTQTKQHFAETTANTLSGNADALTHEYQQLVVRVVDDTGAPVHDYDFDFEVYDAQRKEDVDRTDAFNETKKHVHTYTRDKSYRCFFADYTELQRLIKRLPRGHNVYLSMIAKDISRKVTYETSDTTRVPLWGPAAAHDVSFFAANTTTLVSITLDRRARDDLFDIRLRQTQRG